MIFVDTNVFMYAVGRNHPLRRAAQNFFIQSRKEGKALISSAEVAQELLHAYLPAGRMETLDAALDLLSLGIDQVLDVTIEDVRHARNLAEIFSSLTARDILHLSVCQHHQIIKIKTFDKALNSIFLEQAKR